jgi:hypothetical protein
MMVEFRQRVGLPAAPLDHPTTSAARGGDVSWIQ